MKLLSTQLTTVTPSQRCDGAAATAVTAATTTAATAENHFECFKLIFIDWHLMFFFLLLTFRWSFKRRARPSTRRECVILQTVEIWISTKLFAKFYSWLGDAKNQINLPQSAFYHNCKRLSSDGFPHSRPSDTVIVLVMIANACMVSRSVCAYVQCTPSMPTTQ